MMDMEAGFYLTGLPALRSVKLGLATDVTAGTGNPSTDIFIQSHGVSYPQPGFARILRRVGKSRAARRTKCILTLFENCDHIEIC